MEEIRLISDVKDVRIDTWLSEKLEKYSRTYIQKLVGDEQVFVNDKKVKTNYKLRQGDQVLINIPLPIVLDVKPEKCELDILYEDRDIIVINKAKGMVVHPAAGNYSGTLVNALMEYCKGDLSDINGIIRPGIVHRIDKDTSGVIVVAKNNVAHERLSEMLKGHVITRVYVALVEGVIKEDQAKIDAPIGRNPIERKKMAVNIKNGRSAVTYFKVLERFKDVTYIEVTLETGRTHQIRVHMSHIGYPLIGDKVYGRKKAKFDTNGQALHARVLGFVHPIKNEYMEFHADVPQYFTGLLKLLRKS